MINFLNIFPVVCQYGGWIFCTIWAMAIIGFPYRHGTPAGYIVVAAGIVLTATFLYPGIRGRLNERIQRPGTREFLVRLTMFGGLFRLLPLPFLPGHLVSDSGAYHLLALQILSGEGYGQTAFLPPGYPGLLAGLYGIVGASPLAARLLSILLGIAAIPLSFEAGRRLLSPGAARWAAFLTAIMPTLVFSSSDVHTTSLLVVLTQGTLILAHAAAQTSRRSWQAVIGLGVLVGIGALVKPVFLPVPVMILIAWFAIGMRRDAVYKFLVVSLCAAGVVIPWTIRNYRVLGAFIPVSSNSGYALYQGMNPKTDGMWSPALRQLRNLDEMERDRQARTAAIKWMCSHPIDCVLLMARKQMFMWGTSSTNIASAFNEYVPQSVKTTLTVGIKFLINSAWVALMLLCFMATRRTKAWQKPKLALGVLLLFFVFGTHLVYEVQSRYHIPEIPILILIASAGMAAYDPKEPDELGSGATLTNPS